MKEIEAPARCAHEILINLITTRLVANYTTKIVVYYRKLTKIIRDKPKLLEINQNY